MANTVALVDDDRNILSSLSMALKEEGFMVQTYKDGEEGYKGISEHAPDIAILDMKMPRLNGMEVLEKIREKSQMPIIFLTSKDEEIDQVIGLRMGADDYVTKPFSQRLLIERIRALLRRQSLQQQGTAQENSEESMVRGDLSLDDARHVCSWKGMRVDLTVTEYLLIKTLAVRPGHVKNRDQLIDMAYGENIHVTDRTIDSHIKRIRRKIEAVDTGFSQIKTVYGLGYKYEER